jgi:hypothetical protein
VLYQTLKWLFVPQVILLGLKLEELSWDYAKPSQENNDDCLPCLFIQVLQSVVKALQAVVQDCLRGERSL